MMKENPEPMKSHLKSSCGNPSAIRPSDAIFSELSLIVENCIRLLKFWNSQLTQMADTDANLTSPERRQVELLRQKLQTTTLHLTRASSSLSTLDIVFKQLANTDSKSME